MNKNSRQFDEEATLHEYRQLIKEYSRPTDDELILKLQSLPLTERNMLCLYIACEYRINYFARLLHTNNAYAKRLINEIQNKIKEL